MGSGIVSRQMPNDTDLLRAALLGYQVQLAQLESKAAALRKQLGAHPTDGDHAIAGLVVTKRRRTLSADARKRIAEAQKKRWAAWKAKK